MTFKELQVGEKFKFGPNEAVVCVKTQTTCELHPNAGLARFNVDYDTNEWPVWDDEEVVQII